MGRVPVRNVYQLAAARRGRPSKPMSPAGKIAAAIVVAALIVGAVIIGIQVRREHREDAVLGQAERIMEQAFPTDHPSATPVPIPAESPASQPPRKKFTMGSYEQLQTHARYKTACAILGATGEELSRNAVSIDVPTTDSAGKPRMTRQTIETVSYRWKNPDGSQITAIFQDDFLVEKSQTGLR